jgi:hypothetical protein
MMMKNDFVNLIKNEKSPAKAAGTLKQHLHVSTRRLEKEIAKSAFLEVFPGESGSMLETMKSLQMGDASPEELAEALKIVRQQKAKKEVDEKALTFPDFAPSPAKPAVPSGPPVEPEIQPKVETPPEPPPEPAEKLPPFKKSPPTIDGPEDIAAAMTHLGGEPLKPDFSKVKRTAKKKEKK